MWQLPPVTPFETGEYYRVVGIDPGSSCLGFSVIDINVNTGEKALIWSETIKGAAFIRAYPDLVVDHGDRFARLHGYRLALLERFNDWQPNSISCEAPYMGRFPAAYGALTETVLMIRLAVIEYRPDMTLAMIDPPNVKKCVGVGGKNGDKEAMRKAIRNLPIIYAQPQPLPLLDEHSCDSIAVGYWKCLALTNDAKQV